MQMSQNFAAILGHELRNPLQAIATIGEVLERQITDSRMSELAARISVSTRRMSELIDAILKLAQAAGGEHSDIDMRINDQVGQALFEAAREIQDGNPGRRISLNVDINRSACCDIARLQQVVSNLLGNALAHGSPDGTVRFTGFADSAYLVIEVWNAGNPIPADCIGKIFKPFWRSSTGRHRQGLGLGLHLCAEIVRAHRGKISVVSNLINGTTFTARLPLNAQ